MSNAADKVLPFYATGKNGVPRLRDYFVAAALNGLIILVTVLPVLAVVKVVF